MFLVPEIMNAVAVLVYASVRPDPLARVVLEGMLTLDPRADAVAEGFVASIAGVRVSLHADFALKGARRVIDT